MKRLACNGNFRRFSHHVFVCNNKMVLVEVKARTGAAVGGYLYDRRLVVFYDLLEFHVLIKVQFGYFLQKALVKVHQRVEF